ncbi:extracellular solute-binding protein [Acidianus sulfidivorans JP7]|uniref:Sugar ABC transporter substrate-binding protein n=1 Tax=Acidianus sulfidivorans JP7 TaxID=619593 RepID=A0A2U9IPJ9_9CREN|nr:extracellular solute-binding protein [Acidianus sulfidivorans]AWR97935.1 extracellular solute-binding protein [Acidianus sulfidivorans JP7]
MKKDKAISKAIIGVIVVIIVIIAAVAAYELTKKPTTTTSVTLTVVTFSGESANFIQYEGNLFSKEHPGVTVKVIQYPFSDYITDEISALKAHSTQYDLIGFTSTSAQAVAPYLVTLNTSLFNMSDLIGPQEAFGGIIYNTTTHENETIGIAYETAVYLMAYKTSIFDNATLQEEFYNEYHMNFTPTTWQNWTVVIDADQFLTSHGITKYGFLIDDHEAHGIIDAFPAVYGFYYARNSSLNDGLVGGIPGFNVLFEGKILPGYNYPLPSFNSSSGLEALMTYKQLVSYEISPSQVEICYGNIADYYPEAAGAFLFTSQLSYLNSTESKDTSLAPLPSGYAETGTDFLGISKYSLHKQLAEEFLQFLVSPQAQVNAFILYGKFPISKIAFKELESNTSLPSYERQWLTEVYAAASNAWANPPNIPITDTELVSEFNTQVLQYLEGTTNATTALNTATSEWLSSLSAYYG